MRTSWFKELIRREPLLPWLVFLLLGLALLPSLARAATSDAVTGRLQARSAQVAGTGETVPVWVYFQDKDLQGSRLTAALAEAERSLHPRTARRRAKTLAPGADLVDMRDMPVADRYVAVVAATGAGPREVSRWFNAASFDATPDQIEAIARLPFVRRVDAVAQGFRKPVEDPGVEPVDPLNDGPAKAVESLYDYGPSLNQAALANIPAAHDAGWTGDGVVIGVLDSGFRTTHEAFAHLDVIATYDFVNDDTIVDDEPGDAASGFAHGSQVVSQFAAFSEGNLIGSAFNASVILAKTEDMSDETPIEEDYWVAGLEWVESQGADLVTSSLGYYYWLTYEDLDGDTAVTTRAADMAAARGLLVITSAGNERDSEWGWVTAPADGDSVVAVGATYYNGVVAYFSSPGPTYDGRIKPDVMAQGRTNSMIKPDDDTAYTTWAGTSFACPLTAGVAALLLEKHPTLAPMQIRDALRETALRADHPDNDYGWGMIDAVAILDYFGPKFSHTPLNDTEDETGPYDVVCNLVDAVAIDPGSPTLMVRIDGGTWQPTPLIPAGGDVWTASIPGQAHGTLVEYYFTADDELGITNTLPRTAPTEVFGFDVDLDLDSPVITHTALPDWPARHWAPPVTAAVSDNAFVVSVTVDWSLAGAPQIPFPLVDRGDGVWTAIFPTDGPVPAADDTVIYTITAADGAAVPNTTSDGPHALPVTAALARVLLVDDASGGTGPADMALWLTNLGYDHQTIVPTGLLTEALELYQAVILSTGATVTSTVASNADVREVLRGWSEAGGSIFIESGNLAPDMFLHDPSFANDVMRAQSLLSSNAGYFVRQAAMIDHPVVASPNALGASMVVNYTIYTQDTVAAAYGADVLYSPYSFPGAAGIVAYDGTPAPEGGQLVYITADITALWASANSDLFFENAMAWLTAVEGDPNCSLAGHVNLVGAPDGGATVKVGRFYETTTGPDGSFSLPDMYDGDHHVRVSCPGFEVQSMDLTLAASEHRSDLAFDLRPTETIIAFNDTITEIPPQNPLGVDMFIEVGPGHAGKNLADILVTVDITHYRSGDLILKLYSPTGTEVYLRNRSGHTTPDVVGTFPTNLVVDGPGDLDDMLGEPIEGTWRLNVSDNELQANGEVNYWSLSLFSTLDVSAVGETVVPVRTALLPNVPNPFNPKTSIAFDLAKGGHARVAVFDVRGRRVRTLIDEELPVGRHTTVWDGRDGKGRQQASGVYFYMMETDDAKQIGKMLLVK